MARRANPAKANAEAPRRRKSRKGESPSVRDLEKDLAEAQEQHPLCQHE